MAVIIAGERSGVGKTTVTLTLLACLCRRQLQVQSFKVGPDYIDPMFHEYVTKRACRNLDLILTSETYVQESWARHTQGVDYALIEGVMGLFDGVTGNAIASTAHIARLLQLPVILVLDCSKLSGSVAAIAHGYRSFDSQIKLAGVVLNRVGSDRHLHLLQDALEPLELPIFGVMRRQELMTIPDRHLGLVPTEEISQLDTLIDYLATLGDTCFDWEKLLPLLKNSQQKAWSNQPDLTQNSVRVAIARDRAFNFYYQDNLDILRELGAELVFWSPIAEQLPPDIQGLYFGGGFPEVFAQDLAANNQARQAVNLAIQAGMPTYAECGGLMYLCEQIIDFNGESWSMVGTIPTTATMSSHLTLGYRQATALQNSPLMNAKTVVWGHEFHRSQVEEIPLQPLYQIRGYDMRSLTTLEGWQLYQVHASYVHLHFGGNLESPLRFLQHCQQFKLRQTCN